VSDVDTPRLLEQVQAVHVLSTLAGFEALLRGCRVVCHGAPFYAGWGLTDDRLPVPRRSRRLSLEALVAGALILYPRYVSVFDSAPCEVEVAVDGLVQQACAGLGKAPAWRRLLRPLLRRE
jgi:capsular polysaccharide export protein